MIIGTNAYAPGLTVRWKRGLWESVLVSRLGEHHSVCEATRSPSYNAKPLYVVFDRTGYPCIRKTFTRRCDAKRAAEVLVGQWWREKCEREAKAREWQWRAVCRKAAEVRGIVTADYADGTSEQVEVTTDRAERTLSPLGQLFVNGIREDMFGTTKIRECVPEYGE